LSSLAAEQFGEEGNKRSILHNIKQEMKAWKSTCKEAGEKARPKKTTEEHQGGIRGWRRERAQKHAAFTAILFKFTKGQKRNGKLACLQEDIDQELKKTGTATLKENRSWESWLQN